MVRGQGSSIRDPSGYKPPPRRGVGFWELGFFTTLDRRKEICWLFCRKRVEAAQVDFLGGRRESCWGGVRRCRGFLDSVHRG